MRSQNLKIVRAHFGGTAALLAMLTSNAQAADIVNGWSPTTTISSIYSVSTLTMFKLNGTTQACGHPVYWQLPLSDTTISKLRNAQLLAAFMAGKPVSLRCENSLVTDYEIFE